VCNCIAYPFPHRFGGGKCTGQQIAEAYFQDHGGYGHCVDCHCFTRERGAFGAISCQVVDGQESPLQCGKVQELIAFEEIKMRTEK